MPINEYDDMLAKGSAAPSGNNEYFGMVQNEVADKTTALKTSLFVGTKADPDRQAKVVELSNKTSLPLPVVDRNFDDLSKSNASVDYDDLIRSSPKVSQWLQDPNNSSVSHDDIPALQNVEETVKDFGMLHSMYRSLNVGLAKMYSSVAGIPSVLSNAALLPYNLTLKATGRPEFQYNFPVENKISRYYDRAADAWKVPDLEASITGEIKNGNYGKAGRALAAQFVSNAPNQAVILLGTLAGYGTPALVGAGLMQSSQVMSEAQKKGADPAMTTVDALMQGGIESGFESIGTFGILKSWENVIAKQYGKEVSKQVFKDFGKTMLYSMAGEGNEEFLTQIAQDYSDYITGVNPDAMKGTMERALNAGIIGGVSGGLMTAPTAITAGAMRGAKMRQSSLAKDFYTALGSSIEATKTKQRLPAATKTLVDTITKDSPVENIYVSPDAVDKYFEQAKINPVKVMQDLGVTDSYSEAKKTGGDVKIPLGTWAEKIVGTEHYQGLANDIKFAPDAMSVNETTKLHEEMKAQDAQAQEQAAAAPPMTEDAPQKVSSMVEEQLVAAGRPVQEAKIASQLYEARLRTRATLRGEDPLALFQKEGLQINSSTENVPQGTNVQTYNQSQEIQPFKSSNEAIAFGKANTGNQEAVAHLESKMENLDQQYKLMTEELNAKRERGERDPGLIQKAMNLVTERQFYREARDTIQGAKEFQQASFQSLLERQRNTEGMFAAVKDPKTGELYTGPSHAEILEEAFKTDADLASRLSEELLNRTDNVGFADENLEFVSRQQADRRFGIINSESLRGGKTFNQAAYHGTPHTVDQFSLHKIGTGEGEAAYGWGLYFAGEKKVAEFYRDTLSDNKKGRVYTVDIPEDSEYLNWDTLIVDQPKLKKLAAQFGITKEQSYEMTGGDFYNQLSAEFGTVNTGPVAEWIKADLNRGALDNDEGASKFLASQGVAGIKYLDQKSRVKEGLGTSNYVLFDDKLVKIMEFEQRQGDEEARGRILFGKTNVNIELLKTADQSTFLHETGHLFLNEVGADLAHINSLDAATHTPQQQQFIEDAQTTLKWLGAESFDNLTTEQHEQWARGFESYLMEGKAPTTALRRAFANFKVWLINIYRQMKSLDVNLTDDVRGVMDRLLATDEEITAAQAQQHMTPLFADPVAIGMPEAKANAYLDASFWARKNAEQEMDTKLLKEFNRAKESWYKDRRTEVQKEMETNVSEQRVYKNIDQLKEGADYNGTPFKLGREGIEPEMLKRLPRGILSPRGTVGINVNIMAEMLSYESGDQLLTTLANAPKKSELINRLTDEKMQQLYPDTLLNGTLPNEAMKAVHNEKRSQMLRMELEHLMSDDMPVYKEAVRRIVRRVPSEESVRQTAHDIIGGRTVKEVRPYTYQLAESKSAKDAGIALAQGDLNAAFEAKQRELLNHELYRAAVEGQETIDNAMELYKKLGRSDEALAKTRDVDLVNAARAILAEYGLGRTDKSAMDYIEPIRRYDPDTYNAVSNLIASATETKGNYQTLKFDDFVALKDSVEALWNLSRITEQIEIDGKKLDRETVKLELGSRLEELIKPENRIGYNHAATTWERAKMYLLGTQASLRRIETWVDAMDGGASNGVFRKYIWNPISEAATTYRIAKNETLKKYLDIVKGIETTLSTKEILAPELDYKFANKAELLGALLHTGNESNLSKLLRGRGWGTVDETGILDTSRWDAFKERMIKEGILTKADYDFAQNVWNLLEELKPQAQRAHKAMYGYYFNEITSNQIQTPFGIYNGGYVPAVVDPFASSDAAIRNEREDLEKNNNSYMFPTTGRGFTKSRVDAYAAPLALDLRYVPSHIDKVLRFVNIEPHVKDVGRIVMDKSFRATLDLFDPTVGGDMLVPWLQRTGQQKIMTPSQGWGGRAADTFFRELRTRTGMQVMVASVSNALQQFTGISIAAVKVQPKYLRDSLWQYVRQPKAMTAMINEKSPFMSTRTTTQAMEIMQTIDDMLINPTQYEKVRDAMKKHGYFMQQGTQNVVDVIAWSGAYDEAISKGATENDAVRQADSAVRETQGSFNPEDISRFETGTAFQRAFTQFYSYFNMQANLFGTEFSNVARNMGLKKGAGRLLYVYALGLMIPSVLNEMIFRAMGGKGLDENDDDHYMDDVMSIFFGSQFKTVTAMVPFVGQIINSGINTFNKKTYDDSIRVSPAVSMIEAAVKAPSEVYKAIVEDGKAAPAIRDTLTLLGLATGLPLAPIAKPINYLSAVKSGDAQPTGPIDFARGLVSGKSGNRR